MTIEPNVLKAANDMAMASILNINKDEQQSGGNSLLHVVTPSSKVTKNFLILEPSHHEEEEEEKEPITDDDGVSTKEKHPTTMQPFSLEKLMKNAIAKRQVDMEELVKRIVQSEMAGTYSRLSAMEREIHRIPALECKIRRISEMERTISSLKSEVARLRSDNMVLVRQMDASIKHQEESVQLVQEELSQLHNKMIKDECN